MASATFEWEEWIIPISVSVGVAAQNASMDAAGDLVAAADGALYRAKASGRNRVVSAAR